jgi:hypothetical protein
MDLHITDWIKVVTDPLGLAGFVIFLLFAFFARSARRREAPGVAILLIILACVSLVGGYTLTYVEHGGSLLQSTGNVEIHGPATLNARHSGTAVISGHDTSLTPQRSSSGADSSSTDERGVPSQGVSNVVIHGGATSNGSHSGTAVISGHDTAFTPQRSSSETGSSSAEQHHP